MLELQSTPLPSWLKRLASLDDLPLSDILHGSAYYPACGFDGKVVKFAGGYCHSFVYADYGMTESEVLAAITAQEAFKGYELFAYRKLRLDEWQPETPSPLDLIAARVQI